MGQKPARSPEKSSFAQTCSLLSQYLKEKGSFGDLTLGMTCNVEVNGTPEMLRPCPTMNLFPVNEKSSNDCGRNVVPATRKPRSIDLFPNQAGFPSPDDGPKRVDSSVASMNNPAVTEPQTAQMTIFYGGQVIVFNDFPADKAKEIMLLAGKGSCQSNSVNPNPAHMISNFTNTITQDCARSAQRPIPGGDLPIARRASLHRFLEKRKDRITTRALPYQIGNSAASPSKIVHNKPWLRLSAQSPQ
ncbi:Pectin lyase-like superfamily protein isoform 1 [Hibiscus syriacus]|uniref:Protein TIFY n=2 Tax=Hibiscus syriacus TaxID=106335 RepID=A0A6A2WUT0_HIBSY|nr:Pectin lyase-like superfamily protein isoform 1 [Hibiscus syriacus]